MEKEEEKKLEILITQEFSNWESFSKLNQETITSINELGEIIKGVKQTYSNGTMASYILIKPNGRYFQEFKEILCIKIPYNL